VLSFTSICSPIFGMVGCLIPAWLVYKVPALHKYKGMSLYLIIVTGLLLCVSPFLSLIYLAATIIPVIALCVRRLHDTDRSGAWALLYLVPIIGWLVLFVFACLEGNSGSNRYGNDPKFGSN